MGKGKEPEGSARARGGGQGAAAAATTTGSAAGADDKARKLLTKYAKGYRLGKTLRELEDLHREQPSHMTCLALAKVRVRQAVDAAMKVRRRAGWGLQAGDRRAARRRAAACWATIVPCLGATVQHGEEDQREQALIERLHAALEVAVAGAVQHRSITCQGLCDVLIKLLGGRPGVCAAWGEQPLCRRSRRSCANVCPPTPSPPPSTSHRRQPLHRLALQALRGCGS